MRSRFAFSQTQDGRLLVTMEALWGFPSDQNGKFCVTAIDDENTFIQHVVLANFAKQETIDLIANVLLVVSGRPVSERWVDVTLSPLQLTALGMRLEQEEPLPQPSSHPLGFAGEEDLVQVFTKAPLPLCMMAGPEHKITFVNPAFLRIVRRAEDDVLGKPVREALSELQGQPFFALMDNVYSTGKPFVGIAVPAQMGGERSNATREAYFDFVYHPVRNEQDEVCGILCQAMDVTERVLEKQVGESRENRLYQQWAELDAIYRDSPFGMCLIEAGTFKILRLNKTKADLLGQSLEALIGRRIGEVSYTPNVENFYQKVIDTKQGTSLEVSIPFGGDRNDTRSYIWNLNPVFSPKGEVEAVASTVIDITVWPRPLAGYELSLHGAAHGN